MRTSKVTGKTYDPGNVIYMTNPKQCGAYFKHLGYEPFLDILVTSEKREDAMVFVWEKCPETREAKIKWDNHLL